MGAAGCWVGGDDTGDEVPPAKARLDPLTIPKFVEPLTIPPVMPPVEVNDQFVEYHIAVRQFEQQVLPSGFPKTTVWGYGREGDPLPGEADTTTFHYPGFTIETRTNKTVRVKWVNGLVDDQGRFLPHLFPVDPTLHWANPPGPCDAESIFASAEDVVPYTGPVPIVTHLHGGHTPSISDGYPEAWYLPDASNIPDGYCTEGQHYGTASPTDRGAALFEYPNDQSAATLWYHDHALGLTRLNLHAGLAGFWIIRDEVEDALGLPGPAPKLGDPEGTHYFEIPLVIQDRSFYADGSLFYPDSREFFDGYLGPFIPDVDVPPIWNPEVFGNTIVANGKTWPYLEVEPRTYRFRVLNGSNARFFILRFDSEELGFQQIGSDGGLLPDAPVGLKSVTLAPAERVDVLVDFSALQAGEEVVLLNLGPDEPFEGPDPEELQERADPKTTGQVMKFVVTEPSGAPEGDIPASLPPVAGLATNLPPRDLTLNEIEYEVDEDEDEEEELPIAALLGTAADGPLGWGRAITETLMVGDTEIWRIINLTEDAHPIHLHMVQFQVLDRRPIDAEGFEAAQRLALAKGQPVPDIEEFHAGPAVDPNPNESGKKDTVIANPGEVTRIIATFDLGGFYVWHCHILEHEDNQMMRPYIVQPAGP